MDEGRNDQHYESSGARWKGRIFALHDQQGMGHIRLADNRRVQFKLQDFSSGSRSPKLGDIVELAICRGPSGLAATEIVFIDLDENPQQGQQVSIPAEPPVGMSPELLDATLSVPLTAVADHLIESDANVHYQRAAVARAEGRFADARQLFQNAIASGADKPVFVAFVKMEIERGSHSQAEVVLKSAISRFPDDPVFYDMYGQMERRRGALNKAAKILREGIRHNSTHALLRQGLARVLGDLGTPASLQQANLLYSQLEREGKLNKRDGSYQRFRALHQSPRAGLAYEAFERLNGFRVRVAGRRDLPRHITDLVLEIENPEFEASFGVSGSILMRCFDKQPQKAEVRALSQLLRENGPQPTVGLIDSGEAFLSPSLAIVVVPAAGGVRDHLMSVLSENNEALIPIDDSLLRNGKLHLEALRQLFSQFLGARDLYNSTLPVSGRRFFGRERLLSELTDQVHRGDFIGIYGLRKMGKTSLIYQLRDEKFRDDAVGYVDLQATAALLTGNTQPIYWELERDLHQRLVERYPLAAQLLRLGKAPRFSELSTDEKENCALLFGEDVRELLEHIATGRSKGLKRVIIVLDELERILPLGEQPGVHGYIEFFGLLRGLAQTERYRGKLSSVVVAANASISEKSFWQNRENPVFALYKPIFLPPFSDKDTFDMVKGIGRGMSVYWQEAALGKVFAEAGGHPFITRLLCSRIVKDYDKRPLTVTSSMVERAVIEVIKDQTDKFSQIVELLSKYFPDEEKFLEGIALEQPLPRIGDDSLSHLLGYRLIENEGGNYRMTLNLLRRWLRRRAGISE
jgi:hypothetical protein